MKKSEQNMKTKTRHSSLDMPDPDIMIKDQKKKPDMLSKARNKLYNLGDVWSWNKHEEGAKKSRTQATLEYFFKSKDKQNIHSNIQPNLSRERRASSLQKQHSVDSNPLKIDLSDDEEYLHSKINRTRPSTLCVDGINGHQAAALALERPRKKLSFREPEIMGYSVQVSGDTLPKKGSSKNAAVPEIKRSTSVNNPVSFRRANSWDNMDLEVK